MLLDALLQAFASVGVFVINMLPSVVFIDVSAPLLTLWSFISPWIPLADYVTPLHEAAYMLVMVFSLRCIALAVTLFFRGVSLLPFVGRSF